MRILLRSILTLITLASVTAIAVHIYPYLHPIPVVVFHNISSSRFPSEAYTIETHLLAEELDYLDREGYTTLTFESARTLRAKHRLPVKSVILSFDDAYRGQFTEALPLLKAHHMRATFFINSGWIGSTTRMTWDDVRALHAAGMEIGGHSQTHPHLRALTAEELREQIVGDKTSIESHLDTPITVFAYPFGETNTAIDTLVSESGYDVTRGIVGEPQKNNDLLVFGGSVMTNSFDAFLSALKR